MSSAAGGGALNSAGAQPRSGSSAAAVQGLGFAVACAAAGAGVAVLDDGGRVVAVNDELCHVLGLARAELGGRVMTQLAHPEDVASQQTGFAHVLSGQLKRHVTEARYLRPDGAVVWVSLAVGRLPGSGTVLRRRPCTW